MESFDVKQFVTLGKKIVAAGLNYRSVVNARGLTIPKEPVVFLKPTTSYITEGQEIEIPQTFEVHHEIELGVIIGRKCKNIAPSCVKDYIGGYCLALDLTAADQMKVARSGGLPWTLGKGFDTACPVSRALLPSYLPDPDNVSLRLLVNNTTRQATSTADMIFPTSHLIAFISRYITLEPYDLVLTGSPAGMGPIGPGDILKGSLEQDLLNFEFVVQSSVGDFKSVESTP